MSILILLPGAFHTSKCWERVVPLLEQHEHCVLTPDLAGVSVERYAAEITLELWADQISTLISEQLEPVILTGHSRGGIVASVVAERVPERVAHLVYVSGSLLPDGGSILTHGPQQDPTAPSPLTIDEDGMATLNVDVARLAFLNKTSPEWTEVALSRLVAEPIRIFGEKVHITDSRFGCVPRAYIETLFDNGIPIEKQRMWQATLPCDPVFTLETDHSPFYSDPAALSNALHAIACKLNQDSRNKDGPAAYTRSISWQQRE